MTAEVGSSKSKSKVLTIDARFKCPSTVDKTNWLGGYEYGDKFSISQVKVALYELSCRIPS